MPPDLLAAVLEMTPRVSSKIAGMPKRDCHEILGRARIDADLTSDLAFHCAPPEGFEPSHTV